MSPPTVSLQAPAGVTQAMDRSGTVYTVVNGLVTVPMSTVPLFMELGFAIPDSLLQTLSTAGKVGPGSAVGTMFLLGKLIGANMNSTADQAIALAGFGALPFTVEKIVVTNPSTSLTTAVGGVYTAASKGGTALVANTQVYSGATVALSRQDATIAAAGLVALLAAGPIYFALSTPQGAAATADVYVYGRAIG